MEEYNPNAVWTSKKKKVRYVPPEPPRGPVATGQRTNKPGKKTIVIVAGTAFVLAVIGGMWFFATRPVAAPSVGLDAAAPSMIAVGEPFVFSALYVNSSTVALRNVSLTITLPDGIFFSGKPESERTLSIPLDDIAAGSSGTASTTLLADATVGSVVQVGSVLSYTTDASHSAFFSASHQASIAVGTAVLGLTIAAPANVFAGQDFMVTVFYKNATSHPVSGAQIAMQYPQGFMFAQASPTPAFPGDTIWNLGTLAPGSAGTILITGAMSQNGAALYSMTGRISENTSGSSYAVGASVANIAITAAPLTVSAVVNNDPNSIATSGAFLDYKIAYANVSDTTFRDVVITATLDGAMFDPSSVQGGEAFNSETGTLTWNAANTPALAALAPGDSGSVDLDITTKKLFPIMSPTDKNFTLGLHLTISSPTVPPGTTASGTSASADITNKVAGALAVNAVGYRYEKGSTIKNSGPYPPKVNQPTTYTIHWRVTDYSTDVNGATVSAYLQSGATCTGNILSTVSTLPVCNQSSGEVIWTIPAISAGTGVLGAPIEAIFQIEDMPAVNQVGQIVPLLGKTSITATDDFTGMTLQASAGTIGTDLPDDQSVAAGNGAVTQ